MSQRPHRPARRPRRPSPPHGTSGGALGTTLLALAVVGLVAFVALSTLTKEGDRGEASPAPSEGTTAQGDPVPTAPGGPVDPDEDGLPRFQRDLPILAFREHSAGLPVSGTWLGNPTLADLDGDGDLDLVASNREEDGVSTWRFDPDAPWMLEIDGLPRTMSYGPTAVADLNGDENPDVLVGDHTQALRVFANDGDMHYREIDPTWDRPNLLIDIDLGDIDRDGNQDLVTICHFKGGLNVYLGDGRGGLRLLPEAHRIVPVRTMGPGISPRVPDPHDPTQHKGQAADPLAVDAGGLFGRDVELLDLDGDGTLDIVATTNEGLKAFLTRPGERFAWEEVSTGLPSPSIGNSLYGLDSGLFDEGRAVPQVLMGLLDPTTEKDKNSIGVFAFDAQTRTWTQIDRGLFRGDDYKDAQAADFDGDGHLDVIAASLQNGRVIFLGDGTGGFEAAGRIAGHSKCRFELGDVDGDGLVDVMVATSGVKGQNITGKLRVFLNSADAWR